MAKSDIILDDDHVMIKGELKVDSISSRTLNKPISLNSPLNLKAIKVNQLSNKQAITINQNGIQMFDSNGSSVVSQLSRNGEFFVGGRGRIIAKNLNLSGEADIAKISTSQVSLGGAGNGENPQNGKITILNTRGQVVLAIEAASTAKIMVPGLGDLIDIVKKLQDRVAQLERTRIPR